MKTLLSLTLLLITSALLSANESKVCQKCHPLIYKEYYDSIHRKSSLPNDIIYKKLFDKEFNGHAKEQCSRCHSPSAKNKEELKNEPISCVYCHTIQKVQEGKQENTNILSGKKRDFYGANQSKRHKTKVKYETKSSFFGLIKRSQNSPYHQIEYNNENFYNGKMCMGCHSHVNNAHDFDIIMLDAYIDKKDKHTCISCHMPQVMGSKTTLRDTKTHAYHGIAGIHHMSESLGKYIDIDVQKTPKGFQVTLTNHANHALFGQAYREGLLQVSISRKGKTIQLKPFVFERIFGKNGVQSMPFAATEVLKDTLIYAKKSVDYTTQLQKGDKLTITLAFRLITKDAANVLELHKEQALTKIKILKTESFDF